MSAVGGGVGPRASAGPAILTAAAGATSKKLAPPLPPPPTEGNGGQWGAKKLSLLVDAQKHKSPRWQQLANFVRRKHIPGVELRSLPWAQQQDLLRVLFPERPVKKEATTCLLYTSDAADE